jgi:hypothetical protein
MISSRSGLGTTLVNQPNGRPDHGYLLNLTTFRAIRGVLREVPAVAYPDHDRQPPP